VLLTTNYCLWIAASAAAELAPIANSTSGISGALFDRGYATPLGKPYSGALCNPC
jgi:hypothetical protein